MPERPARLLTGVTKALPSKSIGSEIDFDA
jgi:hypothetical protein